MKHLKRIVLAIAAVSLVLFGMQQARAAKTEFSEGNPTVGLKGTKVTADFLNAVNSHFCTGLDVDGDCALAYSATVTGTVDLVSTISPTTAFPASYVAGMPISLKSAATNTGPLTLNLNGIGAAAIKKNGTQALVAGDIKVDQLFTVAYDGTNFQLLTPAVDLGAASGVATLDSDSRVVQTANTLWDGAGNRSASPTPAANSMPVMDANGTLLPFFQADLGPWNAGTLSSAAAWIDVAYGLGKFVTVNNLTSTSAGYSIDGGATWTAATLPSSSVWTSVAYGNGRFVAVCQGTATAYSTDGVTWVAGGALPVSSNWFVAYGNGNFVALSSSGTRTAGYSTDGAVSWVTTTVPSTLNWSDVTYGNGVFVAVNSSGGASARSLDSGVTWSSGGTPAVALKSLSYGNGVFVAAADQNSTGSAYSTDNGVTWSAGGALPKQQHWNGLTYGNGYFLATGGTTTWGAYSSNYGVSWSTTLMPATADWNGVAFGNGKFVSVSGDGSPTSSSAAHAASFLSIKP